MIERLAHFVAHWRKTTLLLGALLVLPFLPAVLRGVPLDNSIRTWMVDDPEKLAAYDRFLRAFGSDERILAVVRGKGPTQDASLLRFVRDLVKDLGKKKRFPMVLSTVSILTLAPDACAVLLDDQLGGWSAIEQLGPKLEGGPLNREFRLLDLARDTACIGIELRPGGPDERRALLRELDAYRERARTEGRELLLAGQPIVNVELDQGAQEVEQKFMPLLTVTCIVVMLALTRSVRVTALVLIPVGLAVLALQGCVGATGHSFNLLLVIAKPLVFVLALATGLHFAQSFLQGLREGMDRTRAAIRAFDEKAIPCVFTTLSTVYGFGSLVTAKVTPIRELGAFASFGMVFMALLACGPLLAALALLGPTRPTEEGPDRFGALSERIVRAVVRTRGRAALAVLGGAALCALGFWSYLGLELETNALTYFKPDAPVRREYDAIEEAGLGLFSVELVVRAKDGVAIGGSVPVLETLRELEAAARLHSGVTATLSFADVLVDSNWRGAGRESLPDPSLVRDALARDEVVEASKKLLGEGTGEVARAARVTVIGRTLETPRLLDLMAKLEEDFTRIGAPRGLTLDVTGSFPLMLGTQLSLVETLGHSLGGAALTIGITILVFVRSLRRALLTLLPNALPILLNFAFMRALGMPLDVGTVMVSSIVLGIAVDNTIHYFFHYGRARKRGEPIAEACATAARIAGRSLVLATAITVIGFATLLLSSFAPTWRFGVLASVGLSVAVVGTVVVLPALILIFDRRDPERSDRVS